MRIQFFDCWDCLVFEGRHHEFVFFDFLVVTQGIEHELHQAGVACLAELHHRTVLVVHVLLVRVAFLPGAIV